MFDLSYLRVYNIHGDVNNTGMDVIKYVANTLRKPIYWITNENHCNNQMLMLTTLNKMKSGVILIDNSCTEEFVLNFVNKARMLQWKEKWILFTLTASDKIGSGKINTLANSTLWIPHIPSETVINKIYNTLLGGNDNEDLNKFVSYFEHRKVSSWTIQNWVISIGLRAKHKGVKVSTILATFENS